MKSGLIFLTLASVLTMIISSCKTQDKIDQQVDDILKQLTLEEKISLIHGNTFFTTPAIPRLGIPALHLSDGPNGIREEMSPHDWSVANCKNDAVAYFPCLTAWPPHGILNWQQISEKYLLKKP